jgi:SAM-dependent methyltransferase
VDLDALKARHRRMWGLGPFQRIADTSSDLHDRLTGSLSPRRGERWLDVATGTGAVALRAASAGAVVTGIDLAPALIETARRLAEADGLEVRFDVGDAERLPYEDGSFDVVSSAQGVIFTFDHAAAVGELARVCRLGGRLGLTTWTPDGGIGRLLRMLAPYQPPPIPGIGNPLDWGRREYVEGLLDWAFDLEFEEEDSPQVAESGEAVWELFSTSYGPTKMLAMSLTPARREELHDHFVAHYEGYRTDQGIRAPREYLLVLGRRR